MDDPYQKAASIYAKHGLPEDLQIPVMTCGNPITANVPLRRLVDIAKSDFEFLGIAFFYMFKGDAANARAHLEIAGFNTADEKYPAVIEKMLANLDDVCAIAQKAKGDFDHERAANKLCPLDELLN